MNSCTVCKVWLDPGYSVCRKCYDETINTFAKRIVNSFVPDLITGPSRMDAEAYVYEELTYLVNNLGLLRREE